MPDDNSIRHGRTCVLKPHAHLVFTAKYRRKVFDSKHLNLLTEVFANVSGNFTATLAQCNDQDAHMHPLIEYPPRSSALETGELTEERLVQGLRQKYFVRTHRQHLRSPSHRAASCGAAPLPTIKANIDEQKRPT